MKKVLFFVAACLLFAATATAQFYQQLSVQGLLGVGIPHGTHFKNTDGDRFSSIGVAYDIDVLYHFKNFDNKLGLGLGWNSSLLITDNAGDNVVFDAGTYSLNIVGAKGYYRFMNKKISPYASILVGVSRFSRPEFSVKTGGRTSFYTRESAWGLGVRPEIGVLFGNFVVSASYVIPMSYDIPGQEFYLSDSGKKGNAAVFQINIGARINFFGM